MEEPGVTRDSGQRHSATIFTRSPAVPIPGIREESPGASPERTPLWNAPSHGLERRPRYYGSIIGTPPSDETPGQFPTLELPDPAMNPSKSREEREPSEQDDEVRSLPEIVQPVESSPDPYHVGQRHPSLMFGGSIHRRLFNGRKNDKGASTPNTQGINFPPSRLRRMFTPRALDSPAVSDIQLEAYRELDFRQEDFFNFLDRELDKIERFYKEKEEEATERLTTLRSQLHEMRDRRLEELQQAKRGSHPQAGGVLDGVLSTTALPHTPLKENHSANGHGASISNPVETLLWRKPHFGKTTRAMQHLSSPRGPRATTRLNEDKQDYIRRNRGGQVPYRFAKRRLKLALQEFYRALELLKSYALLNRTGFRKINKKYDKAVMARPPLRYMAEKVNQAHFVTSDIVDGHLVAVEDLYARYFERGNHKVAIGKLRGKPRAGDQSGVSFRNGLYVAAGTCFAIAGLVNAADRLYDPDPVISVQTSYLLQIYAGYFLALLLFLLFILDCQIWVRNHINYVFIFEYDTRHVLDWRQLAELPCFFLLLNGLFLYLNFQTDVYHAVHLYWPVMLIAITLTILVFPFRILYYHARIWFGYSNFRLLLAGLYPVEFRDFYLGDMYCSQTYAMGQIELFFCLYANDWRDPAQCNSSHSRLLGFFTALPAVWRALQCLRRFYDSGNWFPHLANCAKYGCNILYYMTLSLYRIDKTDHMRALFIAFAAVNGIYSSFWDVFMDFSLGNAWAKHPFLRDQLAYKRVWVYYFVMVADTLLRQQWIFYAIFASDIQHSAFLSFFVGLAEVLRRGMWSVFRVENEHCNNVGQFRASRDIPLPYELPASPEGAKPQTPEPRHGEETISPSVTGEDLEHARTTESLRRRRTPQTPGLRALQRVGTIIAGAHAHDFQKKRRPEVEGENAEDASLHGQYSSEEEDEGEDDLPRDDDLREAERLVNRANR